VPAVTDPERHGASTYRSRYESSRHESFLSAGRHDRINQRSHAFFDADQQVDPVRNDRRRRPRRSAGHPMIRCQSLTLSLRAARLVTLVALVMVEIGGAQAIARPAGLGLGDPVTYTDAAGGPWCAHVGAILEDGVGGVPWAWITIDADIRRVIRVPASLLSAGCPL